MTWRIWLSEHCSELLRGAALGLLALTAVFFFSWEPAPRPRIGEQQHTVIMQYGNPDHIVRTEQSPTKEKHFPFIYLIYKNGFFKSSSTVITIDGVTGRVLNVTQDGEKGY